MPGTLRVSVAEPSRRLGVSGMTVRRDLDALESRGLVRRVRGGAVPPAFRRRGPASTRGGRGRRRRRTGWLRPRPRWCRRVHTRPADLTG
ncbi:DeoR family transcriptional regulator [Nonomuraea sp. NPDC055795]